MKILSIVTLFLSSQLLANYAFSNEKTVKIEMHGVKSGQFSNTSGFSKMRSEGLKEMSPFLINKPKRPMQPEKKDIPELEDIELK